MNAGGVAVSALEMSQNSERLVWTAEEVDQQLKGHHEEHPQGLCGEGVRPAPQPGGRRPHPPFLKEGGPRWEGGGGRI